VSDVPGLEQIRRAPKVLLHDHLDGGLRAATIVELADQTGYTGLPTTDPDELDSWMTRGASRKDLVLYLETFAHTVGVMQTPEALVRVARECAEDLADDGIVYAEVRFAPELHLERDMALDDVVVTPELVTLVKQGMTRCSMFVHDEPSGASTSLPGRTQIAQDLDTLRDFMAQAK